MLLGGSSRGINNGGSVPSQIIVNGDGSIGTNYDQRSPKEVSQAGLDTGFKLLTPDGNIVDPNTLQSLDGGQRVFQTRTTTEVSGDGAQGGSYGLKQHGTRIYKSK